MITIQKSGKIYVPQEDGFIGYAGDNLNKTIEFKLLDTTDINLNYRLYLKFDDDTVNFLILQKKIQDGNTILSWTVTEDQIYKDGIVYLQIKAFSNSDLIFHTESIPLLVGNSIEFGDYLAQKPISEFLEQEKVLNQIAEDVENAKEFLPYIGQNGNWFVYDYLTKTYKDSGVTAKGSAEEYPIVTAISASSDNGHVPSARAVYDSLVNLKNTYSDFVTRGFSSIGNLVVSSSNVVLDSSAGFAGMTSILTACVSPRVTKISSGTFTGCIGLKNLVIYNSESGVVIEDLAVPQNTKIIYVYSSKPEENKESINLLNTKVGDTAYLDTRDKTSLVGAVNEINLEKLSAENGGVKTENLENLCVSTSKISNNAVTVDKLASNAVTNRKIADGAISLAKISSAYVDNAPSISAPFYGECLVKSGGVYNALKTKYDSSNIETGTGNFGIYAGATPGKSGTFTYQKIGDVVTVSCNLVMSAGQGCHFTGLPFKTAAQSIVMTRTLSTNTRCSVNANGTWISVQTNGTTFTDDDNVQITLSYSI